MPEGDTVWRTARALDRALAGQRLTATDFRVPQLANTDLSGALVTGTATHGKHLLTRLDHATGEWTLHTHLKMEGSWQVYDVHARWRQPQHQARVLLRTATQVAVGFSLGIVELTPRAAEAAIVGHLGPDLLGADWDPDEATSRLLTAPDRPIYEALLDQTNLAGIGNLYAAELCFTSGVHPLTPVGAVPDLPRLVRRARLMLEENKTRSAQTTTGDLARGRRHWVYRRDRQACLRCATPINAAPIGALGRERTAYWCPSCQPLR